MHLSPYRVLSLICMPLSAQCILHVALIYLFHGALCIIMHGAPVAHDLITTVPLSALDWTVTLPNTGVLG